MGVSHATSGAAVGLLLSVAAPGLVGVVDPVGALTFAAVTAGFAMAPDLDHPTSHVTKRFGWASWVASRLVRPLSAAVFRLSATAKDQGAGTHRYLTHTGVAAVGLGVGVNAAVSQWGTWAVVATLFVGLALAVKGIDHLIPGPPSLFAAALLTAGVVWLGGTSPWVGTAVAVGMLVHCAGDAVTESGCPLLWPVRIGGRAWHPVRPPSVFRFRTGGTVEAGLLVVFTATAVWLVVDVVPGGPQLRDDLWRAVAG